MEIIPQGVYPVVPTPFDERGQIDLESQRRCVDFMIDAGSDGLCILANYSEQFLLSDDEREVLTRTVLEHVAGRIPISGTYLSAPFLAQMAREIDIVKAVGMTPMLSMSIGCR